MKPVTNGLSDIQLQILEKIRERPGQLTQIELAELLGKSQQVVSYHVQQLKRAGMIRSERVGGVYYYTIIKDVK